MNVPTYDLGNFEPESLNDTPTWCPHFYDSYVDIVRATKTFAEFKPRSSLVGIKVKAAASNTGNSHGSRLEAWLLLFLSKSFPIGWEPQEAPSSWASTFP